LFNFVLLYFVLFVLFSRPYLVRIVRSRCYSVASVCHSVTLCIVAKRCVLEQELLLSEVVYEKSIGTKMNDLDLCLEVVSRSCQPLRYIRHWISWKPLEIAAIACLKCR